MTIPNYINESKKYASAKIFSQKENPIEFLIEFNKINKFFNDFAYLVDKSAEYSISGFEKKDEEEYTIYIEGKFREGLFIETILSLLKKYDRVIIDKKGEYNYNNFNNIKPKPLGENFLISLTLEEKKFLEQTIKNFKKPSSSNPSPFYFFAANENHL